MIISTDLGTELEKIIRNTNLSDLKNKMVNMKKG